MKKAKDNEGKEKLHGCSTKCYITIKQFSDDSQFKCKKEIVLRKTIYICIWDVSSSRLVEASSSTSTHSSIYKSEIFFAINM